MAIGGVRGGGAPQPRPPLPNGLGTLNDIGEVYTDQVADRYEMDTVNKIQ